MMQEEMHKRKIPVIIGASVAYECLTLLSLFTSSSGGNKGEGPEIRGRLGVI
jgi:hypothetical protein